jgi:enoyl-CoA hydratase
MTRSPFRPPEPHPLPRFTFARRGCRDSRREPRRLAAMAFSRPVPPATPTSALHAEASVTEGGAGPALRRSGGGAEDRPPAGGWGTVPPMADSSGPLVCERRGDALLVGFNRPEKRNAIDVATTEALHHVLSDQGRERCILVLHSTTPGMFVAGADIGELLDRDADDAFMGINVRLFERLEAHRWPTIAVVDGPALGGGCELAMACDLRIASPRARFAQPELNLGILAGAGANWRLAQLVGLPLARRMLYLGQSLDAAAALAAGLVDAVHEPDSLLDAALAMVDTIAARSWRALELTKLALRLHRPATSTFDMAAQSLLFESDDKRERMEKFLNRRKG